jgi:hypothetical protein
MITDFDKIEASIPIFSAVRKKFDACNHKSVFYDQMTCNLFLYTFDTSMDLLHHCGSCKINTKEPTTFREDVRSR